MSYDEEDVLVGEEEEAIEPLEGELEPEGADPELGDEETVEKDL